MESIEPKIVAAISAGIHAYLAEERLAEKKEEIIIPAPPITRINLWGIAGRQDLMLQRRLWQLRLY